MKRLYDAVYKIIAMLGTGVLFLPIIKVLFVEFGYPFEFLSRIAYAVLFIVAGYLLQALFAIILGYRRADENSVDHKFSFKTAALPIAVSVVVSLLMIPVLQDLFQLMFDNRTNGFISYDRNSLYPYLAAAFTALFMIFGAVMWFLPARYIINENMLMGYLPVVLLEYIFCLDEVLMIATVSVFAVASAIILNQGYINKTVYDSISDITAKQRGYNMGLSVLFSMTALPMFLLVACIIVGVVVLIRIPIFVIAQSIFYSGNEAEQDSYYDEYYNSSSKNTADLFGESVFGGSPIVGYLFVLFCILFIAFFVFVIAKRSLSFSEAAEKIRQALKNLAETIKEFFEPIFSFFSHGVYTRHVIVRDNCFYRDEEIKLQNAVINPYDPDAGKRSRSYKDFYKVLSHLPSKKAQLTYAYQTLRTLYNGKNKLTPSDTPRQTKKKLIDYGISFDIDYVTEKYEKLIYAERDLDSAEADKALREMCGDIYNRLK